MSDLISRQAAIDEANAWLLDCLKVNKQDRSCGLIRRLEDLPPAQPKRGKWEMGIDERFVECSECGLMTTRNELRGLAVFGKNEPNFCPNCGADMRGEQDDESRSNSNAQTDTRARGMGATDKSSGI